MKGFLNMKKTQKIGIALIFCGLIATFGFLVSVAGKAVFIIQSQQTSGRVVDMVIRSNQSPSGTTLQTAYPVIRYKDAKGIEKEFETPPSFSKNMKIGQKVILRYFTGSDTKVPKIVRSFAETWTITIILGVLSIILNGIGFPLFWKSLKK
jgi:hypothetical protein